MQIVTSVSRFFQLMEYIWNADLFSAPLLSEVLNMLISMHLNRNVLHTEYSCTITHAV